MRLKQILFAVMCVGVLLFGVGQLVAQDSAASDDSAKAADTDTADTQAEQPADTTDEAAAAAMDMGDNPLQASHEDISYAIGYSIGADMHSRGAAFDVDELTAGMRAGITGGEGRLSDQEITKCIFAFQMQMQQKMMAQMKEAKAKGDAFLAENGKKEGVVTTASGLQYRVIKKGDGPSPTLDDTVKANYVGKLVDGTVFDQSPEGQPAEFAVGRVIPGWTEALQLMHVGSKWELVVPSDLAYGERGDSSGTIGPNEVLVFDVELVAIEK